MCLGVGSDEIIDAIFRCFCRPGHDKILTCPPTYGMYSHSAKVNDLKVVEVPLDAAKSFSTRSQVINALLFQDASVKLVLLCSPGNPTGNIISKSDIQHILEHPTWNGVVVVDEAYIDFAPSSSSVSGWVTEWPNLLVMQILSKAFGLAGARLGFTFASVEIAQLLNNLKAPYNISSPTILLAGEVMEPHNVAIMEAHRYQLGIQRDRLLAELPRIPGVGNFLGGIDANFLLIEVLSKPAVDGGVPDNRIALAIYHALASKSRVILRYRGNAPGCLGSLRITVRTEDEVDTFLTQFRMALSEIYAANV